MKSVSDPKIKNRPAVYVRGRLKTVYNDADKERVEYDYSHQRRVMCRMYRDDKLVFEFEMNRFGLPIRGRMFGGRRKRLCAFDYDDCGQVS